MIDWLNMEEQAVIDRLVSDFAVEEKHASTVLRDLRDISPALREEFLIFWRDESFSSSNDYNGHTYDSLRSSYGMKPMGAWLTLDWLIREPDQAKAALAKGYDKVSL